MIVLRQKEFGNKDNKAAKRRYEAGDGYKRMLEAEGFSESEIKKKMETLTEKERIKSYRSANSPARDFYENVIEPRNQYTPGGKAELAMDKMHQAGYGRNSSKKFMTCGGGWDLLAVSDSNVPDKLKRNGVYFANEKGTAYTTSKIARQRLKKAAMKKLR